MSRRLSHLKTFVSLSSCDLFVFSSLRHMYVHTLAPSADLNPGAADSVYTCCALLALEAHDTIVLKLEIEFESIACAIAKITSAAAALLHTPTTSSRKTSIAQMCTTCSRLVEQTKPERWRLLSGASDRLSSSN